MPGTPRQRPHLIGHHGKTTPLLAGTGRLDRGVERQQVGLLGNALDHFEHIANGVDLGTEAVDTGTGRLRSHRQLLDTLHALTYHQLPGLDLVVGRLSRLRGLLGIARHIVHGGRHLLHGGRYLFGFVLLAADLAIGLLGHRRQCLSATRQLLDALLQAADDARQAGRHLLHGLHQLPDLIATRCFCLQAQLPCCNALGAGDDALERAHHRAGDQPRSQHTHQQRQPRGQGNGQGIARQLTLQGLLLAKVGLVDATGDLLGPRLQLGLEPLLLGQQVGVFVELVGETADVPGHFTQHTLVAGIADGALELFDQARGFDRLGDARLADVLLTLAALVQAHTCFVHRLQH
ncbi:hypothetical protein D3C81_721610 [compost metagenome]